MTLRLPHIAALLVAALCAAAAPARAQNEGYGASYLTPFPPGDVYSILVIGDDLAEGLVDGMAEALVGDNRVQVRPKHAFINGLMRPDFDEKLAAFEEDLKRDPVAVAVVMLGAWDRVTARDPNGKRLAVGSAPWRKVYGDRGDRLMKLLKRQNVGVYWVGLPNVARYDANEDAQMMNDVLRERVYLNGMKYVDVFNGFADENGGYSQWGPDVNGKIVRLRHGDGIYFTQAGNRKLAHFVERELKRDLTQARANRSIPLAGSEEEQARVNPDKAKLAAGAPPAGTKPGDGATPAPAGLSPQPSAPGAAAATAGEGDQKADNGRISLRTLSAGREETVTLDIIRPPISASVVALVTRRESADRPSQMGATVLDQIAGGLTVMSSVTSAPTGGPGSGSKVPAAQTPYFRVLFKGERLTPKPGRADDVSWPRADAKVSDARPPSPAPEETGSTEVPDTADAAKEASAEPRSRKKR